MSDSLAERLPAFIGGSTLTGFATPIVWLNGIFPTGFVFDTVLKISVTIVISLIGGIVGMFSKDIYTLIIKSKVKKLFKRDRKNR